MRCRICAHRGAAFRLRRPRRDQRRFVRPTAVVVRHGVPRRNGCAPPTAPHSRSTPSAKMSVRSVNRVADDLLRRHVAGRADSRAAIGQRSRRGRQPPCALRPAPSSDTSFARPKSMTLTWPCDATMTFAGFRSRCTIFRACAVSSASAISSASVRASPAGPRLVQHAVQRLAGDEFHDDEEVAAGVADFEDLADERVIEPGGGDGFAPESFARDGILRQRRGEDFDGDVAPERRVAGQEDLAHATGAERADDIVSMGDAITGLHRCSSPRALSMLLDGTALRPRPPRGSRFVTGARGARRPRNRAAAHRPAP